MFTRWAVIGRRTGPAQPPARFSVATFPDRRLPYPRDSRVNRSGKIGIVPKICGKL